MRVADSPREGFPVNCSFAHTIPLLRRSNRRPTRTYLMRPAPLVLDASAAQKCRGVGLLVVQDGYHRWEADQRPEPDNAPEGARKSKNLTQWKWKMMISTCNMLSPFIC